MYTLSKIIISITAILIIVTSYLIFKYDGLLPVLLFIIMAYGDIEFPM